MTFLPGDHVHATVGQRTAPGRIRAITSEPAALIEREDGTTQLVLLRNLQHAGQQQNQRSNAGSPARSPRTAS